MRISRMDARGAAGVRFEALDGSTSSTIRDTLSDVDESPVEPSDDESCEGEEQKLDDDERPES